MQFSILRDNFLRPLQLVIGAVEKNQSMPILSNVLIKAFDGQITLIATDLEIELQGTNFTNEILVPGSATVPGRKLLDICKALPEGQLIYFSIQAENLHIHCGKSRFKLTSLSANEFPNVSTVVAKAKFSIPNRKLKSLLDSVSFSMAQQDVRYYLNGIYIDINSTSLTLVTTDSHRLSLCYFQHTTMGDFAKIILPRKAISELLRLLSHEDQELSVIVADNHLQILAKDFSFITKLIDETYPDYRKVIPKNLSKVIIIDRDDFKQALARISILTNEKFHGVTFYLELNKVVIEAHNSLQEEAHEEIEVDYSGSSVEFGFNVSYLLDILNALPAGNVKLSLNDANSGVQIEAQEQTGCLYVVMPMRI